MAFPNKLNATPINICPLQNVYRWTYVLLIRRHLYLSPSNSLVKTLPKILIACVHKVLNHYTRHEYLQVSFRILKIWLATFWKANEVKEQCMDIYISKMFGIHYQNKNSQRSMTNLKSITLKLNRMMYWKEKENLGNGEVYW